jgi:hypothetical protein
MRGCIESREAVAVVVQALPHFDCELDRIRALLRSSGQRDIWLLLDGKALTDTAGTWRALHFGNETKRLHVTTQQVPKKLRCTVDGCNAVNHTAGASLFIWWLMSSNYTHGWHVELDTFYAGCWAALFDGYNACPGPDLVAKQFPSNTRWWWSHPHRCRLARVKLESPEEVAFNHGQPYTSIPCNRKLTMSCWNVLRLSRSLARTIVFELSSQHGMRAYHEALVELACSRRKGCSSSTLNDNRTRGQQLGSLWPGYNAAHMHEFVPQTLARMYEHGDQPLAGHVYHPAKCEANGSIGSQALAWCRD